VVPQKAAITPYSKQSGFGTVGFGKNSSSRKVNGGGSGGGGASGGGRFGGMF
jgi:carbohydrate-binding DOMON domain-containing protein